MIHKYYTFDMESYYDSEYSLRKMTVPEYLHDPRFECTGCAVAEGDDGKAVWYDADDFRVFLRALRMRQKTGEKITVVSHNSLFDMCLLAWKFGFLPDLCIDTMGMSRALLFHKTGYVSLAKIAAHLGLPAKTDTILKVQGMRAADIKAAGLWGAYTSYACNDVDLCRGIFKHLRNDFPASEYVVCDTVLRCAITPRFKLDADVLAEHLHVTLESKANLLERCGLDSREALMSNEKFAEVLRSMGVEPGTKISLTTGNESYAFAKTDDFMAELEEHENPDVQALVAARLGFKSTIEETRTQRFLALSRLDWGPLGQGWMPVPLRYAGAHTHRLCLSGDTVIAVLRDNRVVYTRLDTLRSSDLVWDGAQFVTHGGLAYAGIKEVIEYQGVVGTPDHRVRTVEYGYRPLAEAKARGCDIARGAVPDAARIDPPVFGPDNLQDAGALQLLPMPAAGGEHVEGLGQSGQGVVQVLRGCGEDGWGKALGQDVGACRADEQGGGCSATGTARYGASPQSGVTAGDHALSDTAVGNEVEPRRLASHDADDNARVSALPKSESIELQLLWRARGGGRLCLDGPDGGLVAGKPGAEAGGHDARSDQHERALRTWEPALGDTLGADEQPKLVATWDIIDCGPHNCFMANGRVVHNSGDWSLNLQNMGRKSPLRRALIAPKAHSVVAGDESQIEARCVAYFAGQDDLVESFAQGRDVYSEFAGEEIYHREITRADTVPRHIGKTAILGLGYGMGGPKFTDTANTSSRLQLGVDLNMGLQDGTDIVNAYRRRYASIKRAWDILQALLPTLASGGRGAFGPCEIRDGTVIGPNGLRLYYRDLQQMMIDGRSRWRFKYGRFDKDLYGGKLFENIIQFLARIITMNAALTMRRRYPRIPLALQAHDELVYVVPDELVTEFRAALEDALTQPVPWAPGIPLACETGVGANYGEAK